MSRGYIVLLALLVSTAPLRAEPLEPVAAEKPPIHTRQTLFSIPFQIDKPKSPQEQPTEVQLSVSADRGASWQVASKVKPEQGNFVFRAPHDGEYWFSIRTINKQQTAPPAAARPELVVIVDTVPPRLDLSAARDSAGAVVISWKSVDPALKGDSLKLEVQAGAITAWENLAVDRDSITTGRHTLSGEANWWPKNAGDAVKVRATISDLAGNSTVRQADATIAAAGALGAAAGSDGAPTLAHPNGTPTEAPRSSLPAQTVSSSRLTPAEIGNPSGNLPWPASNASGDPFLPYQRDLDPQRDAAHNSTGSQPPNADWRTATSDTRLAKRPGLEPPVDRPVTAQPASTGLVNPSRLDLSLLPAGERPRMVSSRSFELDYEVESVGPSGIAKVELWLTRDGGRTWAAMGVDNDNRSPLPVTVDAEGIYGFRIVFESGNGISGFAPQPGDAPEVWVGVDLTRPVAKISEVTPGGDAGELLIRWQAGDELLASRPIALSYGERANGPWTPIASDLENTGSFTWRVDNRVPAQVFVRIETRDEAGNVGVFVSQQPVSLDRQRPQGRIRGVRTSGVN